MSYCSLSQKMSIGIAVDSSTKPCGGSTKEPPLSIPQRLTANRKASVPVNMSKEDGFLFRRRAGSRAPLHPVTVNTRDADRRSAAEAENAEDGDSVPVKEVLQEQPTDGNKQTLRMKLLQILGSNPVVNQKLDNSVVSRVSSHEMMLDQASKEDSHNKHRQNSDTIETDSENVGEKLKKPVVRSVARRRVPTRTQHRNLKPKSLSCDREERQGDDVLTAAKISDPSKPHAASHVCSLTERNNSTKRSRGTKPDENMLPVTDLQNIQQVMLDGEKLLPRKQGPLGSETASPPSHVRLNETFDAATEAVSPNGSPVIKDKYQLQDEENLAQQEKSQHHKPFVSEHPAPQDDGTEGPLFKRRTVFNSLGGTLPLNSDQKQEVHGSPQAAGWSIPEKLFPDTSPAIEQDISHSSDETAAPDEIHADAQESSTEKRDTDDGSYNPSRGDSDGSEEVSSTKEVCSQDAQTSSDELLEKPTRFQSKRRHGQDVNCNDFSSCLTVPRVGGNMDDILMEALGGSSEDGLARMISLLGMALEKLRNKMALATNKRCSDILMSAAEEVHTQLQDVETQIQADLGKLASLKTSKRKHLEMMLQEQQENLRVIHAKFKEDIHKYLQDCRSVLELQENDHSELKGAIERQKTMHKKLLVQAEAAVENHLTVAERRIVCVRKLGKQKMQQLKVAIGECFKDVNLSQE